MAPPPKIQRTLKGDCGYKELFEGGALTKLRAATKPNPVDMIFFNKCVPYHGIIANNRTVHFGTIFPLGKEKLAELHHTNNKLVGILIGIVNYGGTEGNHAIGAVKHGKMLYVCDSLGDKREKGIINKIAQQVAEHYGCTKVMIYDGPNLQRLHVCVGYSSNFIYSLLEYFNNNGTNLSQKEFNSRVPDSVTRRGVFGRGTEQTVNNSLLKKPVGPRRTGVKGGNNINNLVTKLRNMKLRQTPPTVNAVTAMLRNMYLRPGVKRKR